MWPPPSSLTRTQVHVVFDPPKDNNCLFHSLLHIINGAGVGKISPEEQIKAMRCEFMDYLHENMNNHHPFNDAFTWRQIVEKQFENSDQSFMRCEEYLHVMRKATPFDALTMWGGELEMQLFAIIYSFNVAVYLDELGSNTYKLIYSIDGNVESEDNVIYLLHTDDKTHYKVLQSQRGQSQRDQYPHRQDTGESHQHPGHQHQCHPCSCCQRP